MIGVRCFYLLILISPLLSLKITAQDFQQQEEDSIPRFTDVFIPTGIIDYDAEYYYIDSENQFLEHHFILQPIISDVNIVNLEFGLTHSRTVEGNFTTPADMIISYQRNIKSARYKETGFQGLGARIRFFIPTGRGEYLSGLDSWTLEPGLITGLLLNDPRWFVSAEMRYNYSFASLPNTSRKP